MPTRTTSTSSTTLQIGEVAERTGLSLRTIRHYEEVGLLPAAERSPGGFRLYSQEAVDRLLLVKQMKPLGFTLEEMAEIIDIRERLGSPRLSARTRAGLLTRLEHYQQLTDTQLAELTAKVRTAETFAAELRTIVG